MADTDGDGMPDGWEVRNGLNARSGLADSLIGWWKLDDGEGTVAVNSAQDAYHGELVGFSGVDGGWTTEGRLGGALRFDGLDDWVRIAQEAMLPTGGAFTISAWVKLDGTCTSDWPEAVGDMVDATWNGYCLGGDANHAAFAMVGPTAWIQDTNSMADEWTWLALEFDGADMRLYRDGAALGDPVPATFVPATNGYVAIGNGPDVGTSERWKGLIDDVRIYGEALGTNDLADLYAALEDPDGDGLSNREECELGTDIRESNEVVLVYFVDGTNSSAGGQRSTGGGETTQFVTWNALQAKAASTVRFKEGYAEFTNSTLPPSDPPKWYLGREYFYIGEGDSTVSYDGSRCVHSESNYCFVEFSPYGWYEYPSNHVCMGCGHLVHSVAENQPGNTEEWNYCFDEPSENVPTTYIFTHTDGHGYSYVSACYTNYAISCYIGGMAYYPEVYSHAEAYVSNNWNDLLFWHDADGYDGYEMCGETLTNEYTDALLLACTTNDLGGMTDWDGLEWGQRWAREDHHQTPAEETLPTNEIYSAYLLATNHASIQLQKLHYRWSLPSVSGVVYKVIWWEKFIPANGGSTTTVVQRTTNVLGTGGTVYTPAFDIRPPATEGHVYPVPMESVLKVDIDGDEVFKCTDSIIASLLLKSDCYSPNGYVWTVDPPQGLSVGQTGDSFVYYPGASTLGTYTVRAQSADLYSCFDTCIVHVVETHTINATSTESGASANPPPFEGHTPWPFDVTHSPDPDRHMVVFYKDVVDSSFNVQDFDITLNANVLPTSITANQLSEVWSKISGPNSGDFDRTDTFEVKYQNPKQGGVYRFDFDLGISGCTKSEANIVLPLAGAEIDGIVSADIGRANVFSAKVIAKYTKNERNNPFNLKHWFWDATMGDYLGRPENAATPTVWAYNQVCTTYPYCGGDPKNFHGGGAVATWKGKPTRIAKASNFMVGYGARRIGVTSGMAWLMQLGGTGNDSSASKSWDAGWAVGGGADYDSTVAALVVDIWDEAGDKSQKLWPNPNPIDNYVTPSAWSDPDREFRSPLYLYTSSP